MNVSVFHINYLFLESLIKESDELLEESNPSVLVNHHDILFNKEGFENGTINLCFVTGLSGSGKSTLTRSLNAEKISIFNFTRISYFNV